jgi:hypothetical protein
MENKKVSNYKKYEVEVTFEDGFEIFDDCYEEAERSARREAYRLYVSLK